MVHIKLRDGTWYRPGELWSPDFLGISRFPSLGTVDIRTETCFVLCVMGSLAPSLAFIHNVPLGTAPPCDNQKGLGRCRLGAKLIALVKTTGLAGVSFKCNICHFKSALCLFALE